MNHLQDLARIGLIAADLSAGTGQSYREVYAALLNATDLITKARRDAWQEGSVHGASHLANLQHANPYREEVTR